MIPLFESEIKSVAEIVCMNFIECDLTMGCGRCNELRNFVEKVLTKEEIIELEFTEKHKADHSCF
jgi:hypothetical protein